MDPALLGLVALWWLSRGKRTAVGAVDTQAAPPANPDGSAMTDQPPIFAYLYQLPADSFTTTRMAFGRQGDTPTEMGVFGSPDAAVKLARDKGWTLAWSGVKQLSARPGA